MKLKCVVICVLTLVFVLGVNILSKSKGKLFQMYEWRIINSSEDRLRGRRCYTKLAERDSVQLMPKKLVSYFTPLSKDLVVHGAYFDDRPRYGHSNITIFFIVANTTLFDLDLITGCGVGTSMAKRMLVRCVYESKLMHRYHGPDPYLYEQFAVECYDLSVLNGTRAFITYKTGNDAQEHIISESLQPLMVPAPRVKPTGKYNFTVAICTKVHNKGVIWFPEFIRYQRTIGVDHIHLSILEDFIKDGGIYSSIIDEPFLREAIDNGYISVSVWTEWHSSEENYDHSTILQYLDCYYRFRGTYDYVSPMDTDDFFTPRSPGKTQLKDYIYDYCHTTHAGSCYFKWLWLYPGICGLKEKVGTDGNVTKQIISYRSLDDIHHKLKSIHSTAAIIDSSYHDAKCEGCLMPGCSTVAIPPHEAYVAHNRLYVSKSELDVC